MERDGYRASRLELTLAGWQSSRIPIERGRNLAFQLTASFKVTQNLRR